ncbi:MAG: alcohol dehydrogenase catalytic domain-containing protein, partial [Nitrososphaerota archaeon]|nr:alcohol dehydrogenase catalytic domain-containing protein [Nitrososphaerota archaeon]
RLHKDETLLLIEEAELPQLSEGEALIDVLATGLCRTDLKIIHGFLPPPSYPHILGHEIAGRVVDAKPSNPMEKEAIELIGRDQTVLAHFYLTCHTCRYCLGGRSNLCLSLRRLGFELPGGYAEFVKVPITNLIATSLGGEAAVLTDAGATILHALRKSPPQAGEPVVVMGVGGLGSFAVQLASLMGGEVTALDVRDESLSLAQRMGANATLNVNGLSEKTIKENLLSIHGGRLPSLFLDLVGDRQSQQVAITTLAQGGKLIQVGYANASYENVTPKDLVYKEIQMVGSRASTMNDLRDMVNLAESRQIKLEVTKRGLSEINGAVQDMEHNKTTGRIIIVP